MSACQLKNRLVHTSTAHIKAFTTVFIGDNELTEALPNLGKGPVDKFQGQEAPVVIYSMTSSSPEDASGGMSVLYSPSRMNVATNRAKCT